jgi:UDP-3-O-[3-hydroxymyristoyl] glucosamine N-acyltransferase
MRDFSKKFWQPLVKLSLEQIRQIVSPEDVVGNSNTVFDGLGTLKSAQKNEISFFHNSKYAEELKNTKAGACIIKEVDLPIVPEGCIAIIVPDPYYSWSLIIDAFFPQNIITREISEHAKIDKSVKIGMSCHIGAYTVVEAGAVIGDCCYIESGAYIGHGVIIGNNTIIGHSVTIKYSEIGSDCIIHPGVKIGQDGFGFATGPNGVKKVQQVGGVVVGNNVEIGSNTCIDRGAIGNTCIGNNTKVDNLVQIAHNVVIGESCFIAGQTGIAGSTVIGNGVMIGGQVGIAGHIEIGDGVMIAAGSGIMRSIEPKSHIGGYPAVEIMQWHRQTNLLKNMAQKDK